LQSEGLVRIDPKQIRIAFVDDRDVPVCDSLKNQGYNVDLIDGTGNLDNLCDGRYHIIFFDVRGVGANLGGDGLDILRYVAEHNPLIHRVVFTAKALSPEEAELARQHSNRILKKDPGAAKVIKLIEDFVMNLNQDSIVASLDSSLSLNMYKKYRLKNGWVPDQKDIAAIAKGSVGKTGEATQRATNLIKLATALIALVKTGLVATASA
jgi:hypothetical protein